MIQELLHDVGLSEKEARMYVTLLRHGTQPTSFLARRASLNRGTAYVVLHSLLAKGLAVKTTKRGIQYFAPQEPAQLLDFLEHRKQQLQSQRERVQAMMGQLTAIRNPLTAKPKIEFFDGPEGARAVLDMTLKSKDKTLRAFLSIVDVMDFVGFAFFDDYTTRRIQGGYTLHAIRTLEKDKRAFATYPLSKRYMTSRKERREIRHAPEDLAFPITMYLFGDKLAVISSKEEGFALLIESQELADMQKKLFSLLWSSLGRK